MYVCMYVCMHCVRVVDHFLLRIIVHQAIYTSTAQQIGLARNSNVPELVPHLLTRQSYAYSSRFLRKWINNPPPRSIGRQRIIVVFYAYVCMYVWYEILNSYSKYISSTCLSQPTTCKHCAPACLRAMCLCPSSARWPWARS